MSSKKEIEIIDYDNRTIITIEPISLFGAILRTPHVFFHTL